MPKIAVLDFVLENKGEFANTTVLSPYLHELGHKYYYDCIEMIANCKELSYAEARNVIDCELMQYIDNKCTNGFDIASSVSIYARRNYMRGNYTEVVAECFASDNEETKILPEIIKGGRVR
jgi:hypothetical protein